MKPENKLPVLELISAEMKAVVNTFQADLPPARNGNDCRATSVLHA